MSQTRTGVLLRHLRDWADPNGGRVSDRELLRRFADDRVEEAFTALVRRHGPMVLRTSARVLHNRNDAEDVCQATFLVLAAKAASRPWQASVAGWLHQVAYHLSLKANAAARRREIHERRAEVRTATDPLATITGKELQAVLDEELARLPEKYRAPLVLSYLEGLARDEAAARLGCPLGTLKSRVQRGRELLRLRIAERGFALAAVLSAAALMENAAGAAAPVGLWARVANGVFASAAGKTVMAGAASARALSLAGHALKSLALMRLKVAAVLLFAAIIITGGAGTVAYHALAPDGQPGPKPPAAKVSRNAGARPAERRDRSGDPLPEGAVARLGTTRLRHGGPIGWFQFTPDGNTLVSQAGDGVRTWRATTGEQLHFFPGDGIRISGASLSPDGKLLATPGKSGVQVWEVATGRRFRALGTREVFQVCFSPDGKTLVAQPNHRSQVELWDAASGRCLHSWETGRFPCAHLTFADGGKIVIAAGSSVYTIPPRDDHQILYWGAASGKELRLIRTGTFNAHRIAVSPDGALLAAASVGSALGARESERRIRLWDVATGKEIRPLVITPKERFPGQSDSFTALAFAPDGRTLYAGGIDGTIIAWDAVTGKELRRIGKGLANPGALAVSPDHTTLAANIGSAIRLLDLRGGQDRLPAVGHDGPVNTAVVTPDGRLVVTAEAYCIHVWDMATGRELRRIEAPDRSWFTELCLLGDGRTVLTAEQDRNLKQRQMRVWNLATGKELRRLEGGASHLALAPDGKTIALSGSGNAVLVKDLATGKELRRLTSHGRGVYGTAFTPDGRSLVVWGGDNAIRLSDLGTGKEVRQFTFADERPVGQPLPAVPVGGGSVGTYFTAAVSPDGRLIACGSQTGFIALHELATGRLVRKLEALDDGILALAFAPDGKTLAWGGQHDGIVRVVDLLTGHERRRFSGHKGLITTLAFSTDGRKLVSGSWDTTAVVWDLYGGRPK